MTGQASVAVYVVSSAWANGYTPDELADPTEPPCPTFSFNQCYGCVGDCGAANAPKVTVDLSQVGASSGDLVYMFLKDLGGLSEFYIRDVPCVETYVEMEYGMDNAESYAPNGGSLTGTNNNCASANGMWVRYQYQGLGAGMEVFTIPSGTASAVVYYVAEANANDEDVPPLCSSFTSDECFACVGACPGGNVNIDLADVGAAQGDYIYIFIDQDQEIGDFYIDVQSSCFDTTFIPENQYNLNQAILHCFKFKLYC